MPSNKTIFLIRNIAPNSYGGAEIYQLQLAQALRQSGFDPIVLTSSKKLLQAAKTAKIKNRKCPYLPQQNWGSWRRILLPFYALWQVFLYHWYRSIIRKYQPLALQVQSRDDMIAVTLAGRKTNTRVIWTDHADLRKVIWLGLDRGKNPIGRYILKLATIPHRITTVSQYEYNQIQKLIRPKKLQNLVVIKNGVVDKLTQAKIIPQSIIYLGRITAEKGIKELIDAFTQISSSYPKATLDLYGDGPDLPILREYAASCPAIKFHGYTNHPLEKIASHQIYVLPSYHEGLSLSLLDAAMLSKAIIATNIDGNPEVVADNHTGLLVPPQDSDALAQALQKLLSNPKLCTKLGHSARAKYQQEFNFEKIVKQEIIPLYEN